MELSSAIIAASVIDEKGPLDCGSYRHVVSVGPENRPEPTMGWTSYDREILLRACKASHYRDNFHEEYVASFWQGAIGFDGLRNRVADLLSRLCTEYSVVGRSSAIGSRLVVWAEGMEQASTVSVGHREGAK